MISIENQKYDEQLFQNDDVFICAIGYEQRSYYLFDRLTDKIADENKILFLFDDYLNYNIAKKKYETIENISKIDVNIVNYNGGKIVGKKIISVVKSKMTKKEALTIHIDYSSMPRTWYYNLPILLKDCLRPNDVVYFWYVVGKYPDDYETYPSAGVSSYTTIGYPSLRTEIKRTHVIGLSYDKIRTQGILSILDPDSFIVCNAYDPYHQEVSVNVKKLNNNIVSQARLTVLLHIDDFSFMISKLSEIANEFLTFGDVVFVPDGPKPLIFAFSLIPQILNKIGISCLHISRNEKYFQAVDVLATDTILGFKVS